MLSSSLTLLKGIHSTDDLKLEPGILESLTRTFTNIIDAGMEPGIILLNNNPAAVRKKAVQLLAYLSKRPAYQVDPAQIFSKFIAATEKNLDRIFKKAQEKNAILFVDEADALFGRRKRADKQERYTTASVDWLLERFEASKCFVLVGANDRGSLDSGFMKRIKLAIEQSGA